MCFSNISVWFSCKFCKYSFPKLENFLEHKKCEHLEDFEKTKFIVFEERTTAATNTDNHNEKNAILLSLKSDNENVKDHSTYQTTGTEFSDLEKNARNSVTHSEKLTLEFEFEDPSSSAPVVLLVNNADENLGQLMNEFSTLRNGSSKSGIIDSDISAPLVLESPTQELGCVLLQPNENEAADPDPEPENNNSWDYEHHDNAIYEFETDTDHDPLLNPYVLLKRLTWNEIQNATSGTETISSSSEHYHPDSLIKSDENNLCDNLGPSSVYDADANTDSDEGKANNDPDFEFECKLCFKKCHFALQLSLHINSCALSHPDRGRYCIPCNRLLCRPETLKCHYYSFHATPEEKSEGLKFKCSLCPKSYALQSELAKHTRSKHQQHYNNADQDIEGSVYKCTRCPKSYSHYTLFKQHTESHERRDQQKLDGLQSPISIKCDICGISVHCFSQLSNHLRSHTGERPFKCPRKHCGKTFKTNSNLSSHLNSHLGTVVFKCTFPNCDQTFNYRSNLRKHMNALHSETLESCSYPNCSEIFGSLQFRTKHLNTHMVRIEENNYIEGT